MQVKCVKLYTIRPTI